MIRSRSPRRGGRVGGPILLVWMAVVASCAGRSEAPASPGPALPLDGSAFQGVIRASGIYGLIGVEGTLSFSDGHLSWTVGEGKQEYQPAPYTLEERDGQLIFRARLPGETGDWVDWEGLYDGRMVRDVRAVWTRVPGDFVHDLLLPGQLTLRFRVDQRLE